MARLFKHGVEVLHADSGWEVSEWDDGKSESREVYKWMVDYYANGDVKLTRLVKRQWRYSESAVAAAPWRDRRPRGGWAVDKWFRIADKSRVVARLQSHVDRFDALGVEYKVTDYFRLGWKG